MKLVLVLALMAGAQASLLRGATTTDGAAASAGPSGTYTGSKTVLGETIGATLAVSDDQTTLDIALSGVLSLYRALDVWPYPVSPIEFLVLGGVAMALLS